MTRDEERIRRERATRLKRRIEESKKPSAGDTDQQPDESDGEYVQRRMREIDRKGPAKN
jgi:hypothetical protein